MVKKDTRKAIKVSFNLIAKIGTDGRTRTDTSREKALTLSNPPRVNNQQHNNSWRVLTVFSLLQNIFRMTYYIAAIFLNFAVQNT